MPRNALCFEQSCQFSFLKSGPVQTGRPPAGEEGRMAGGVSACLQWDPYPDERDPQSVSGTLSGRATLRAVNRNRGLNVCLLDFSSRV